MKKKYYSNKGGSIFPQDVKITQMPPFPCGGKEGVDDTMYGIDRQLNSDIKNGNKRSKKDVGNW